jgi:hypothetical protein
MAKISEIGIVAKIIRGDNYRKTRFHDEKGHLMGLRSFLHIPRATLSMLLAKAFNYRPCLPWLSYTAISRIEKLLQPDAKVVEFGSGMSTIWFSRRAGFVLSIEHNEAWYVKVSKELQKQNLTNVKYELYSPNEAYSNLSDYPDQFFDFCLVDGINRLACVASVIPKIQSGGFIYLDDSDVHRDPERVRAEQLIVQAVKERGGNVEYFVDFAPTLIHAKEGLLGYL